MKSTTPTPALPRLSPIVPSTLLPGFPERKGWRRQANVSFVVTATLYLLVALWLALDVEYYFGDALSRAQGAQSVLYSRNPNLSVMGFVFTPLTTLAQLPLVAFAPLAPELTRAGLAGAIVSALFMAAAVRELWLIASERGVRFWFAVALTSMFALNPMIILYGAVGMSEAPFIYATLWASRRLVRWTSTDDVHDLIKAGFALALAFLARYDAVVMAFVAMLVVGAMTWRSRQRREWSDRLNFAVLDMLLLVWPIGLMFLTWSISSWLSTGDLLAQFTSIYGNSAIIEQSGGGAHGAQALIDAIFRTLLVAPALPVLLPIGIWYVIKRHDLEPIFPAVMMLSVIVFQIVSYAMGSTFGLLRFFIIAIPLSMVLLIQIIPAGGHFPSLRPGVTFRHRSRAKNPPLFLRISTPLLVLGATAITGLGMSSATWAPQEFALKQVIPGVSKGTLAEQDHRLAVLKAFSTERYVAKHLDALDLNEGEVLASTTYGFAVLTASENQKQFVIPSDQDFITSLNNPASHGIRYILTSPAENRGVSDPINLRYPGVFETGGDIATLEVEFKNQGEGQPDWRLYRVLSVPVSQ